MINTSHPDQRLRQFVTSLIISAVVVGVLVGNAYIETNMGYPAILGPVIKPLFWIGLVAAIPPGSGFWILDKLGLAWELRGRESFIQANPELWLYCVAFYTVVIYLIRRAWSRWHFRRKQ